MRKFLISYSVIILLISSIHFFLIYKTLRQSEDNHREQVYKQLNYDTEFLMAQTNKNLEKLISDIELLPIPPKNVQTPLVVVQKLLKHRKELFHLNYFSADGNLKYSSRKATLEWQSNLLNANWYRNLIKNWQVTITDIHKSPVSPFPQVIAIAIPVLVDKTVNGFWLAYLDLEYSKHLFVTMHSKSEGLSSTWFDSNGEIINISTKDNDISELDIKSNGWWYKINETGNSKLLTIYKKSKQYLYSAQINHFENLQLLIVQDQDKALILFYSFRLNIIIISIILQLIIMSVAAVLLWQWQKQKKQLSELFNVNSLLETKSGALVDTNEKLDRLVTELDEQKNKLLQTKNNLERVQKYLNFLTLPVIALDTNYKYEFVNRAAETEFNYTFEKLQKKPLEKYLQIKNKTEFIHVLNSARKSLQRREANINIQTRHGIKNFMVSCDYLFLNDWQGFIITFSDLTQLLQLQDNIKSQNIFLEKTSCLTELFLLPEAEKEILTRALKVLKEYSGCKNILFYQNENDLLMLRAALKEKQLSPAETLPNDSIAAAAVLSGNPVIIKNKSEIPANVNPLEKQYNFHKAIFHPVILNNQSAGVIVVIDPKDEIIADYENTLQKLFIHFKIGLSALMAKTKLQIANDELEKSAALRAQLLRSITHGLKTPLSTIKGYVKLIQLKFLSFLKEKPELNKFIQNLDSVSEDMNDKIMMYLDMARINRNDLSLDNKQLDISELIGPLKQHLSNEADIKNITIDYSNVDLDDVNIAIDPQRFGFVFKTIFINALKYSPEGDTAIFSAAREKDNLLISFEDHGRQILKKHISLIGSEFLPEEVKKERLHYSDSLAMALAVKIIDLAGAQLKVDSNKEKTVHSIHLPLN